MSHYDRARLAEAFRRVGMRRGDVVFSHSNVGYFGLPAEGRDPTTVFEVILGAFQDVLGPDGTLVVPTFTYSFCRREPFDPAATPSACGLFTERLRTHPGAVRSHDPIFSVAALGARAEEMTADAPAECFGRGSFWDRLLGADGLICNLNFDAGSTFVHYVERCLNVPYRFDKLFPGRIVLDGREQRRAAIFFCRDLSNPDTDVAFEPLDRLAREKGAARTAPVGRGAVVALRAADCFRLIEETLPRRPWFLTVAEGKGVTPQLLRPADTARFGVDLPPGAPMAEMLHALWRLPRDIVSDGYDAALEALARQAPMQVHEYPTGEPCWTWIVPEKWTCREAWLETLDGRRLIDYADHPLHVVSYSLPFDGEVPREELLLHLHTHPGRPAAIPFVYKYYERDWGLCCTRELKDSLLDERYHVRIDTEFSADTLKVGEIVAPGASDECFVLCAHLCHPAQVNDDLSGLVVGVDVMRRLLARTDLRYTYRLLILPETIGSVAYLSHNEALVPRMKGGLFLEMLAKEYPHVLQRSFAGDTEVDRCFELAFRAVAPDGRVTGFDMLNDERQFNAPGVRVPMLALYRILPRSHPDWPYPEYHSSDDNESLICQKRLEESRELVLRMIDTLERNRTPRNEFKGEVYLSRFGLHLDWNLDPAWNQRLYDVMFRLDGTRSIADIASELDAPFDDVYRLVAEFERKGLVSYLS